MVSFPPWDLQVTQRRAAGLGGNLGGEHKQLKTPSQQLGSGFFVVGKVHSRHLPSLLPPPALLPHLPPSLPPPFSPAHSSWFIFGCKFMAPFVFLILLQTILKPQTFLLGANKLNTCMPPRQNINCGVLMNDVVLDSETKQAVSLHHCLLPPQVSGSRMSTQPTDCFYFILSFPFLSQLCLFWDYYAGTEHGPGKSSALLPRLDASEESLSPTFPVHRSTPTPAARILHRETPSWPRALLSPDLKPKGCASWPFPIPICFSTKVPGSLTGRDTGVPPSPFAELQLPTGLTSRKSRAHAITLPKSRFALPSLQRIFTQGSALPKDTHSKSGATALISLEPRRYKWELTGRNGN